MRITLTRHGESENNRRHIIGGDARLTETGRAYAQRLSEWAASAGGRVVYASTKRRCGETAAACGQSPEEPVRTRGKLDEINAGICEHLSYGAVSARYPEISRARSADKLNYRYPDGESYRDLVRRVAPVVAEIVEEKRDVLVVSHQAISRVLLYLFGAITLEEMPTYPVPLHTLIHLSVLEAGTSTDKPVLELESLM